MTDIVDDLRDYDREFFSGGLMIRAADEIERLREALRVADDAIAEMFRYYDGGEMRGSYDGRPERDGLRKAGYAIRAALKGQS